MVSNAPPSIFNLVLDAMFTHMSLGDIFFTFVSDSLSGLFVNGKGSKEANKNEVSSLEHFFSGSDDQL